MTFTIIHIDQYRIGRSEKSSIDQLYTGLTGCTSRKDQLSLTQHRKCVAYMANVVRIGGGKASQAKPRGNKKVAVAVLGYLSLIHRTDKRVAIIVGP